MTAVVHIMRGREERRRRQVNEYVLAEVVRGEELARAKAALLDDCARRAQDDLRERYVRLTEQGVCWRCMQPLEARSLLAMLPGAAIFTHAQCEDGRV